MNNIDTIEVQNESFTAMVCEQAALFGATPGPDEFDNRPVWDEAESTAAVTQAFRILAQAVPDGTQLADERANLLWGFVNTLDAQTRRLDRAADRLIPGIRELQREQDGSEIRSRELELKHRPGSTISHGAQGRLRRTARHRRRGLPRQKPARSGGPRRGSHVSQTGKLTSAMIDARDFQRARKDRENTAHLPQGTLVAVAGGKEANDASAKSSRHLDKLKAKYTDVVLVHGGGPGAEKIAAGWAERNGVHQVVCKPDWNAHGRAAPFRRNDELLGLTPQGCHRVPGLRHHRQPRRQGEQPRHPRPARRRLSASTSTGRVVTAAGVGAARHLPCRPSACDTRAQATAPCTPAACESRRKLQHPHTPLPRVSNRSVAAAAPASRSHRRRFPHRSFPGFGPFDALRRLLFSHLTQRAAPAPEAANDRDLLRPATMVHMWARSCRAGKVIPIWYCADLRTQLKATIPVVH